MENKVVKKPQNQTPDLDKAIITTSPTKAIFNLDMEATQK